MQRQCQAEGRVAFGCGRLITILRCVWLEVQNRLVINNGWDTAVPRDAERLQLCCRATDTAYNTQPERVDYNLRGYLSNAWSKVTLQVAPRPGSPEGS